ncbi:hypothetical protein Anapl_00029 [Anas platyrhynchos]|uniref:Uncharacterized protein n=1 Tax=Anas platyrhynchos TaxID=8839 RepID=R0K2L7_ANAPL|nr:hypothetical protein Anapl_00029 [Anas platyrhynchos]
MPRLTETLSTEGRSPGDFEDNASDTEHKPGGAGTTGLHGHMLHRMLSPRKKPNNPSKANIKGFLYSDPKHSTDLCHSPSILSKWLMRAASWRALLSLKWEKEKVYSMMKPKSCTYLPSRVRGTLTHYNQTDLEYSGFSKKDVHFEGKISKQVIFPTVHSWCDLALYFGNEFTITFPSKQRQDNQELGELQENNQGQRNKDSRLDKQLRTQKEAKPSTEKNELQRENRSAIRLFRGGQEPKKSSLQQPGKKDILSPVTLTSTPRC